MGASRTTRAKDEGGTTHPVTRALERVAGGAGGPADVQQLRSAVVPPSHRSEQDAAAHGASWGAGELALGELSQPAGAASRSLASPVRTSMERTLGTDLGDVRLHEGAAADRVTASVDAAAVTVGSDVWFSGGVPDSSPGGLELLAHELAHTAQPAGAEPVLQREAAGAVKERDEKRERKKRNDRAKELAKTKRTDEEFADLTRRYQEVLSEAEAMWTATKEAAVTRGLSRHEANREADREATKIWDACPYADVSALRPLNYDPFERRLRQVREARNQDRSVVNAEIAESIEQFGLSEFHNAGAGKYDELAKENKQRHEQERRFARITGSQSLGPLPIPEGGPQRDSRAYDELVEAKLAELRTEAAKEGPISRTADRQLRAKAEKSVQGGGGAAKALESAAELGGKLADPLNYAATALKVGAAGSSGATADTQTGLLATASGFSFASAVSSAAEEVNEFFTSSKRLFEGSADRGEEKILVSRGLRLLASAGKTARSGLISAERIIAATAGDAAGEQFVAAVATDGGFQAPSDAAGAALGGAMLLPGLGLAVSALSLCSSLLQLEPALRRWALQRAAEQAFVDDRSQEVFAAAASRMRESSVVQLEKLVFSAGKNATMLGLHIAEIATAGAMGGTAAARAAVTAADLLHQAGHMVWNAREEELAARAKKQNRGAHAEGSAEKLVRTDPATAVDVIVYEAQRRRHPVAIKLVLQYGIELEELDSMMHDEVHAKITKGLGVVADPKSLDDKWDELGKAMKTFFKGDARTGERSLARATGETVTFKDSRESVKDKELLAAQKNKWHYKEKSNRSTSALGSTFDKRGADEIDLSFVKLREHILTTYSDINLDDLPYSHRERANRNRSLATRDASMVDGDLRRQVDEVTALKGPNRAAGLRPLQDRYEEGRQRLAGSGAALATSERVVLMAEVDYLYRMLKRLGGMEAVRRHRTRVAAAQ